MPSLLELLGFATGAACVWLLVKASIWNWPVAIANNLFYKVINEKTILVADDNAPEALVTVLVASGVARLGEAVRVEQEQLTTIDLNTL